MEVYIHRHSTKIELHIEYKEILFLIISWMVKFIVLNVTYSSRQQDKIHHKRTSPVIFRDAEQELKGDVSNLFFFHYWSTGYF
jgi:hypothetical protein